MPAAPTRKLFFSFDMRATKPENVSMVSNATPFRAQAFPRIVSDFGLFIRFRSRPVRPNIGDSGGVRHPLIWNLQRLFDV